MDERWCSTKVDAEGNHMEGTNHYGYCPSSCPSHYEIQTPQVTVTPHGVTAVPAITRKPKVTTPSLPQKMSEEMNGKFGWIKSFLKQIHVEDKNQVSDFEA